MIFLLQNLLHYTGDYINKKYSKIQSAKTYPKQNPDIINKLFFVPYKDENDIKLNHRLYIAATYDKFTGESGPYENYTKVLRFDLGEPYVAILVDKYNKIIVADTRILLEYKLYPGYKYIVNHNGLSEAHLNTMTDWDTFNEEYAKEKIWTVHVQANEYIGQPAYIEYFNDILTRDKSENILPYYEPIDIQIENTARYKEDLLNRPIIATERGYVIRADQNGTDAEMVVMVVNETTNERRYLLGSEAFFYIDTDENKVSLEDLNLWQSV